jgi:hypothetical protein
MDGWTQNAHSVTLKFNQVKGRHRRLPAHVDSGNEMQRRLSFLIVVK